MSPARSAMQQSVQDFLGLLGLLTPGTPNECVWIMSATHHYIRLGHADVQSETLLVHGNNSGWMTLLTLATEPSYIH